MVLHLLTPLLKQLLCLVLDFLVFLKVNGFDLLLLVTDFICSALGE